MRVLWLVSGLLLQIPEKGNMIMDCGDGTWGQMCRFFGLEGEGNVWDVLRDLKVVYVSHAHADHHAGLAKILAMRKQVRTINISRKLWNATDAVANSLIPHPRTRSSSLHRTPYICTFASTTISRTLASWRDAKRVQTAWYRSSVTHLCHRVR